MTEEEAQDVVERTGLPKPLAGVSDAVVEVLRGELQLRAKEIAGDLEETLAEIRADVVAALESGRDDLHRELVAQLPVVLERQRIHVDRAQWAIVRRSLEVAFQVGLKALLAVA